jgi:flagellar hook-associated protein 1 FlgK
MAGLLDGLELGKRALATHQLWLNTIGHNIANVNTPGYTRQRVNIATTYPFEHPVGPMGTGVMATGIEHIRDLFLNQQYRAENKSLGNWAAMEKTLSQIEALFSEPSDDSLSGLLNDFWNSWSAMEPDSENSGARSALRGTANLLAAGFHRIYNQLMDIRKSIDNDITLTIEKVNIISGELASLNLQIARYESGGDRANDLRDKRDNLIDQLSEYIDVNVRENENGTATVYVGALAIVDGDSSFRIGTQKSRAGSITVGDIVWEGTSKEIKILNGQLKALLDVRDKVIPKYIEALDDLAETLITSVNELHRNGYGLDGSTGLNFFDTTSMSAADIKLASGIERDVNRIALSLSGEVGDNRNALAISELRFATLMQRGTRTISEYYQAMIGEIGVTTSEAKHLKENYELLVAQIDNARQSVQGVSLDEEMTQMIKFQHAFDAASRVITAMDQALDTVINGMGVVGR